MIHGIVFNSKLRIGIVSTFVSLMFVPTGFSQEFSFAEFPKLEQECLNVLGDEERSRMLIARIESKYDEENLPEAVLMLSTILEGGNMGLGGGWFRPASQSYDWSWLAATQKIEEDKSILDEDFQGDPLFFDRLDRNGDGELDAMDFDWSPANVYLQQQSVANSIYRKMDASQDGRINRDELMAFFDQVRAGSETVSIDQFRRAIRPDAKSSGYLPGDEPSRERLLRGFFNGEVGSLQEGPRAGQEAPDFELSTQSGDKTIRLKDLVGEKPIVLVFGNFTCGPFRRTYPDFDEICERYRDRAHFVGVYVREAHPSDGWLMESNTRLGVKLPQPKTIEERTSVAQRCATELKYSMPLLVDTLDDRVGNLYSAMPARAYVIGKDGKVTYQGGRGPFGFRPAEMEQSLILTLMQ